MAKELPVAQPALTAVEICAGAGGQSLGLELAGFEHLLAIELDAHAANTLRSNLGAERVREGDVADPKVWRPSDHTGTVDLLAGGVPCPPFSVAGRQHGALDERDLFAWAVSQVAILQPKAVLLENVRGLAGPRFAAYRQHVVDQLRTYGYQSDWRILQASDFGVAQLRPRFVLVATRNEFWSNFAWPTPTPTAKTVGSELRDMMASRGWRYADDWAAMAGGIAPTVVGGSKKHGGADLGPTRAKAAWKQLAVDGKGLADEAPGHEFPHPGLQLPRLTVEMVARIQGWDDSPKHQAWINALSGGKTARYRQVGNAFPPPVAQAVGTAIRAALRGEPATGAVPTEPVTHEPIYRVMAEVQDFLTADEIARRAGLRLSDFRRRIGYIEKDFLIRTVETPLGIAYKLDGFRAFTGQEKHPRHLYLQDRRSLVS